MRNNVETEVNENGVSTRRNRNGYCCTAKLRTIARICRLNLTRKNLNQKFHQQLNIIHHQLALNLTTGFGLSAIVRRERVDVIANRIRVIRIQTTSGSTQLGEGR